MRKILAFMLSVLMVAFVFTGCEKMKRASRQKEAVFFLLSLQLTLTETQLTKPFLKAKS